MREKQKMEKPPLILIVDDIPKNLQVLGNILGRESYRVAAATNGKKALHLLENISPDIILLDIMMPELNGFDTCRKLKENPETKEIPVIFLTARTESEDIVTGIQLGAVDYVTKPFNASELLARVRTHIALKQAKDARKRLIRKLETRNQELARANLALKERQNVIVRLLLDISSLKLSGDRHAVRNFAKNIYDTEKNRLIRSMIAQVFMAKEAAKHDPSVISLLEKALMAFGLPKAAMNNPKEMEKALNRVVVEEMSRDQEEEEAGEEDFADIFAEILADDLDLDGAHAEFLMEKDALEEKNRIFISFDPFALFFTLRNIHRINDEINKRFSTPPKVGFSSAILLSSAILEALVQAETEKGRKLTLEKKLAYDPELVTNQDALVYMFRDLFYNAADAGANHISILSLRPCAENETPYMEEMGFELYPSLYLCLEDNGKGITPEKAKQLNRSLRGEGEEGRLSDKPRGGLGTKNLREFLLLHRGRALYRSSNGTTRIHLYFERLEI